MDFDREHSIWDEEVEPPADYDEEEDEELEPTDGVDEEAGSKDNAMDTEEEMLSKEGEQASKNEATSTGDYEDEEDSEDEGNGSDSDPGEDVGGIEYRPSYRKANRLQFKDICEALEWLDKYQRNKNSVKKKLSKQERLKILLPPKLLEKMKSGSPFPLFRLLMPDKDTSRKTRTKEQSLANAYAEVLGFRGTPKHDALKQYTHPHIIANAGFQEAPPSGDLSIVVEYAVREEQPNPPSKATVGDINAVLDSLVAGLSGRKTSKGTSGRSESQQWRFSQESLPQRRSSPSKAKKKAGPGKVRKDFVDKLVNALKLSPKEHKWLIRMMLSDGMKIGLGFEAILNWWNPHAETLWKSHNSLMACCDNLCNPAYIKALEERMRQSEIESQRTRFSRLYEFDTNIDAVRIGSSLSAMKSERTSFEECMTDMSRKHKAVLAKKELKEDPIKESLALKFPAFVSEIKMDGERMVVHIHRGKVSMHTRQGRWYSPLYSPIIGPSMRRAIAKYDIDVVLDGEILAWDNKEKKVVEFGNNRTIAILRQNWLRAQGRIEEIDRRLHEGENDAFVIEFDEAKHWRFDREKSIDPEASEGGDQCWVKFVSFDVLFVGGPDAKKALAESLSLNSKSSIGSVADMTGFERKRILYNILDEQENEAEIVETVVTRPNGECAKGEDYFSSSDPITECGIPAHTLDSAKWTLNVGHPDLKEIDNTRRKGRTDLEISQRRTAFVNSFYHSIVDEKKLEGLVFKDLAAPYILRTKTGFWRKLKPDYAEVSSHCSDIDVVIIGASYGVGTKRGGQVASFLGACTDSKEPGKFMPFVRLNAKSVNENTLEAIMDETGFVKGSEGQLGCWFTEEEHGKTLPDFISQRSLQFGKESNDGWKFDRVKNYPDLFIKPSQSVVLTVKAAEIVESDEYSAGVTLRFPRISRPRLGADGLDPEELEDEMSLFARLQKFKNDMNRFAKTAASFEITSPTKKSQRTVGSDGEGQICQFLTVEQFEHKQKQAKKRVKKYGVVKQVRQEEKESNALLGIKFHVVEGTYLFDEKGLDAEQAKAEGWFGDAKRVYCASDVETFIIKHGGSVLRTPGLDVYVVGATSDMKVNTMLRGMDDLRNKEERANAKKRKNGEVVEDATTTPGVLKWTYVLSLTRRWQNEKDRRLRECDDYSEGEEEEGDFEQNDESILSTLPGMLKPRFFDFVVQSKQFGDAPLPSIWHYGPLDTVTMKQALNLLQEGDKADQRKAKKRKSKSKLVPWQVDGLKNLAQEKRWVLSCEYEKLWPYGSGSAGVSAFGPASEDKQPVIVYPDLFGDNFGLCNAASRGANAAERWEQALPSAKSSALASSLPLLRCMGSRVTHQLSKHVTHVLCDLNTEATSISWHPGDVLAVFADKDHGRALQERLEDSVGHPVLLISRGWVNGTFDS